MSTERKHHEFSPSKLQFLEACPGYSSIDSTNEASELGVKIHDAIESGECEGKGFTDPQLDVIMKCIDYYEAAVRAWPGSTLHKEVQVSIDEENTTSGYLDIAIVSDDLRVAKIIDWKTGQNAVEPTENNLQGIAYLLGVLYEIPTLEEVTVEFVMPFQGADGIIDKHTFRREEFPKLLLRVKTVVARARAAKVAREADEEYPGLNANTSTCLFCANIADCPAVRKIAIVLGKKYDPLIVPDVINPSLINNPVDSGKAMKFFAVIGALAAAYRSAATNKAATDENFMPEGYTLVTSTRRKVISNQKFYEVLRGQGLTPEQILAACEFTLGPVEKIVSDAAPRGKKKLAVEELGTLLAGEGATEEGQPVVSLRQKKPPDAPAIAG